MRCPKCGGEIIKVKAIEYDGHHYAYCEKCKDKLTFHEYRSLQADKLIEMVREQESK